MTHAPLERPAWEVAEVIHQYGDAFRAKYGAGLTPAQRQATMPGIEAAFLPRSRPPRVGHALA